MSNHIQNRLFFHDVLNTNKQVKNFLKRNYKFLDVVKEFSEEHFPKDDLVKRFFRRLKNCKVLRYCHIRWHIVFRTGVKPAILLNIYKNHSRFKIGRAHV